MTTYLIDADVFMQAKNLHYAFDFCLAFWSWLDAAHESGTVFSIEKVGDEILAGTDELATWASTRESFFLKPDGDVVASLRVTSAWANAADYGPSAVNVFLQVADYYLVAHAHAHGHVVVTHEKPGATKKIKIPDACIGVGVKCMTPYEMLRAEKARFVLPGA